MFIHLDIRHSGNSNRVTDALSRNPVNIAQVLTFESVGAGEESPQAPTLAESDITSLQRQDPKLIPIFKYLEEGVLPDEESCARKLVLEKVNFEIVDGVLFYFSPILPDHWRLAVPKSLREVLMKEYHDGTFAGHFGEQKIYKTLSTRYWWQGMRADVRCFCRACLVCASWKGTCRSTRPPLQPIPVGRPLEMVGVDILQLPPSHNTL